jgi:hypothetical protein
VSSSGIGIDQSKLLNLDDWPVPSTGKQIMSFLGFCNYFRDFIPCYSSVAEPLERLRYHKEIPSSAWTSDCATAFDSLKALLRQAPLLSFPDFTLPFYVATDASNVGVGAVLYQRVSGDEVAGSSSDQVPNLADLSSVRYVAFAARALSSSERNYSATKKELLGVIFALDKFHYYLWGRPFTLFTDHRALTYIFTQKHTSPMIVSWLHKLLDYNFTFIHRPGLLNVLPDHLSRLFPPHLFKSWEEVSNSISLVAFISTSPTEDSTALPSPDPDSNDPQAVVNPLPAITESDYLLSVRENLLHSAHDFGHFGSEAMFNRLLHEGHNWSSMRADCVKVAKQCVQCQRYNDER